MKALNNLWIKWGCFLTGWNYDILKGCSEASFKAIKKYASSFTIVMLLWGVIGYMFAKNYISLGICGCIITSLAFITIVIQIERQITLTVGKNWGVIITRGLLALIMSLLGATIFDQVIFKNDIEREMSEMNTIQMSIIAPERQMTIQKEITNLSSQTDSLETVNSDLMNNISAHPSIIAVSSSSTETPIKQEDGTIKYVKSNSIQRDSRPNPRIAQYEANAKSISEMRKRINELSEKKIHIESEVLSELKNHVGFLNELKAIWRLITKDNIAMIFYLILFFFTLFLEFLVVFSKMLDTPCDYEKIVEHQVKIKIDAINKYNIS